VPLWGGPRAARGGAFATALQCRFAVSQGGVAPAAPEPPSAVVAQPQNADAASGHRLRVAVERVLCKASSQVRGVWRP
jgi:hypothetical protein